jgi:hypothetical protein
LRLVIFAFLDGERKKNSGVKEFRVEQSGSQACPLAQRPGETLPLRPVHLAIAAANSFVSSSIKNSKKFGAPWGTEPPVSTVSGRVMRLPIYPQKPIYPYENKGITPAQSAFVQQVSK